MNKLKTMMLMAGVAVSTTMSAAEDPLYMIFSHPDGAVTQIQVPFVDNYDYATVMKFTDTAIEISIPSETDGVAPAQYSIGVEDIVTAIFSETTYVKSAVAGNSAVFTPLGGNSIRITSTEEISAGEVCVYDTMGKQQPCQAMVIGTTATVSLGELPAGVYVIVYQNNSIKVTKK